MTYSTSREFSNPINSLKSALSCMFGQFKEDGQALFAGKLAIKFAVGFLAVGKGAEGGDRFLHALMICSMLDFPRKICGCYDWRETRGMLTGARIWTCGSTSLRVRRARPVLRFYFCFFSQS